jgi:hypothetical protein
MTLTTEEMEAKLAALEDRVALLCQVVDRLERRLDRKEEVWTDWALILRAASAVIEGEMRQVAEEENSTSAWRTVPFEERV